MIDRINLENFKCFRNLKLSLTNLNVLTGLNSSGKSSVLHSLILTYQTALNFPTEEFIINGELVQLGKRRELVDKVYGSNHFKITLEKADQYYMFKVSESVKMEIVSSYKTAENIFKPFFQIFFPNLHYIAADRQGPAEIHTIEWSAKPDSVGPRGERTLWFILKHAELEVNSQLRIKNVSPLLPRQVEAWMAYFFPGSNIDIQELEMTNLASFGVRTSEATGFHRPQNVGFGFSYTLPIVTACLGAKQGEVVIIENPEAHLHPAGQSRMGEFLVRVARTGVQVIVETHSDHIINGIRKSVKQKIIQPEEVKIYFFRHRKDDEISRADKEIDLKYPQVFSPVIDEKGRLDQWPEGFCDQYEQDLGNLVEW